MNDEINSALTVCSKFEESRSKFGGKCAGLKLLDILTREYTISELSQKNSSLVNVPHFNVDNSIFEKYELFIEREVGDNFQLIEKKENLLYKKLEMILNLSNSIDDFFNNFLEKAIQWMKSHRISGEMWHFRGSTTNEDWINKELFGSLPTVSIGNFDLKYSRLDGNILHSLDRLKEDPEKNTKKLIQLWEERENRQVLRKTVFYRGIFDVFNEYYILKRLNPELLNDKLSIAIMPSIISNNKEVYSIHSTIYSSIYSEQKSPTRIELTKILQNRGNLENEILPLQLVEIDEVHTVVYPSTDIERYKDGAFESIFDEYQRKNPYVINGKNCALSKSQLSHLKDFSKFCEKKLGFPIDLECIILDDPNYYDLAIFPVQIRPIPRNISKEEIEIPGDAILLTKTPFVYGVFEHHAKLLDKSGYSPIEGVDESKFLIPYTQQSKYSGLAKITLDASTALSHDMAFLPSGLRTWDSVYTLVYEKRRDKYAQIGFIGGDDTIHSYINQDSYFRDDLHIQYSFSPMSISIKSDGMRGIIYMTKEQQELFNTSSKTPRPQKYIDHYLSGEIPF
jgi:hypothetical protein